MMNKFVVICIDYHNIFNFGQRQKIWKRPMDINSIERWWWMGNFFGL